MSVFPDDFFSPDKLFFGGVLSEERMDHSPDLLAGSMENISAATIHVEMYDNLAAKPMLYEVLNAGTLRLIFCKLFEL
jgi:hypothetical protein